MSFLSFRSGPTRHLFTKTIAPRRLSQQTAHDGKIPIPSPSLEADQGSFGAAGVHPLVTALLRVTFANVQKPTAMQRKLIRAMSNNRHVLLQDDTGTGKSFAVMLALLSKLSARKPSPAVGEGENHTREALSGLLIVPHRDLAYQYLHWIHHMTLPEGDAPFSLTKYAQVLVRRINKSTSQDLPIRMQEAIRSSTDPDLLVNKPPHILIATSSALLELIERQPEVFRLVTPSTVVVDEVDALLHVPGGKPLRGRGRASQKKLEKHIPDLVRILDRLYPTSRDRQWMHQHSRFVEDKPLGQDPITAAAYRPQLVMISATLRKRLQHALFSTFRWVQRGEMLRLVRKRSSALPAHRLGRSAVHHVLVVSKTGDIRNIVGARPLKPDISYNATLMDQDTADDDDDEDSIFDDDDELLDDDADKELLHAPLAFDPAMLEAVAATLALDVPRLALLVLPATAAVRKIIFELRQFGVNAHAFDLVANEASRTHVLSRTDKVSDENPVLIVATLATVRGIDLPDLTHVFMLGIPEGRSGDAYLHVAGRVGRFGRRGKVITVLEERREESRGKKVVVMDGPKKMTVLLSQIGIQPSRLEHFD